MKKLELSIVVSDDAPDESLRDIANVIKQEIGETGLNIIDVTYRIASECESQCKTSNHLVM